jgi:hypothetical protein
VFLFTTGHEVGFLGLPALIDAEGSWFTGADAHVHLGWSLGAPTATEAANGTVTVNPVADPSGVLHYSENPLIESIYPTAFSEAGVTLPAVADRISTAGEQVGKYTQGTRGTRARAPSAWAELDRGLCLTARTRRGACQAHHGHGFSGVGRELPAPRGCACTLVVLQWTPDWPAT